MFGKTVRLIAVLLAAVGVPFFWFNKSVSSTVQDRIKTWFDRKESPATWDLLDGGSAVGVAPFGSHDPRHRPSLTGASVSELSEFLRFDVTPNWISQRWARVSTVRVEQGLEGLRVPLVTGTNLDDLAGSLTYYFDKEQRVRRITFYGHTGDDRKLVSAVTQQFGMRKKQTLGAGLYLARWNGKPTSVLRIEHAPVVRSDMPHGRLEVTLELNRPDAAFQLSREAQGILDQDQEVGRW